MGIQVQQGEMTVEVKKESTIEENLSKLEDCVGSLRSLLGVKVVASDREATESKTFSTSLIRTNGRICELISDVVAIAIEIKLADEILH